MKFYGLTKGNKKLGYKNLAHNNNSLEYDDVASQLDIN